MTITAAGFKNLLGVSEPSGNAEYVVPSASVPLTAKDDWFGYMRETLGGVSFNPQDPSTFNAGLVSGYQVVGVGGAKTGTDSSGLSGVTVYTASVLVDGQTPIALSVVGSAVTTYALLMAELTRQLNNFATCALVGGNVRITSKSYGAKSTIAITNTNLFSSPLTGYTAIATAVAGVTPFAGMAFNKLDGAVNSVLVVADKATFDANLKSVAEVSHLTCVAEAAGNYTGKYFAINSPSTSYYVWYTLSGVGVDPALSGKTGIVVDIVALDANTVVATKTAAAIDLQADFVSGAVGAVVNITDAVSGAAVDLTAGNAPVTTIVVDTQGAGLGGAYTPV